jgi:hypothetical protein
LLPDLNRVAVHSLHSLLIILHQTIGLAERRMLMDFRSRQQLKRALEPLRQALETHRRSLSLLESALIEFEEPFNQLETTPKSILIQSVDNPVQSPLRPAQVPPPGSPVSENEYAGGSVYGIKPLSEVR